MTKIVSLPSDFYGPRWELGNYFTLDAIVLHTTQGTDSRTWLTKTGGVSAHDLLRNEGGEGVCYEMVARSLASWHAGEVVGTPTTALFEAHGRANPNLWTYGIEIEGYAVGPVDPILVQLAAQRIVKVRQAEGRALPLLNHADLSPGNRSDPGTWRAAVDAAVAEMEDSMTPQDKRDILDKSDDLADATAIYLGRQQRGLDVTTGKVLDPDDKSDPANTILAARAAQRAARPPV